ncbi:MAG: hypothetical protein HZA34_00490 [Candidatus Pacebacteria bacterium]|nr:hypothetical protein [Candidatus Paceibacterota bacterium]
MSKKPLEIDPSLDGRGALATYLKYYVGIEGNDEALLQLTEEAGAKDEFWGDKKPPKALIFCSSSTRKAMMLASLIEFLSNAQYKGVDDFSDLFPQTREVPLYKWFAQYVTNGDGSLAMGEPIYLGTIYGVQIWVQPTSGETKKNEMPAVEAMNKATNGLKHFLEHAPEALKRVAAVCLSGDTAEHVKKPNGEEVTLGKPINMEGFPDKNEDDYAERVAQFCQAFIQENYAPHAIISHLAGLAAVPAMTGVLAGDHASSIVEKLTYEIYNAPDLAVINIDVQAGGGAVTQQYVTNEYEPYRSLSPYDKMRLVCYIMGAQLYQTLDWLRTELLPLDETNKKQMPVRI